MRLHSPVVAVVAASLLLAGCAGNEPEASDTTAADTSVTTDDAVDEDTADEAPMGGGGMGNGGDDAMGEPADASDATRTIQVDASDMAFDPETISVEPDEVVTFEVTNTGEAIHEFFLGDSAMQQEHAEEMAGMGDDMPHDEPYSLRLDPGQTKELTWRFAGGGQVEFACHEPGHYQAGMHGRISVG
jgi:uncharacterized cupredoxin-like copper-binding protein